MAVRKNPPKIAQRRRDMRAELWPDLDPLELWDRKESDGWLSIPRAMPLLLRIIDGLCDKGKPASSAYLDLWCRTFDDSFVFVNKEREMAVSSGFTGERAVRTWSTRINSLKDLGFIDIKGGPNGPISYVLLYNPYLVVRAHRDKGGVSDLLYNSLRQRMIDVGARDLDTDRTKAAGFAQAEKAMAPSRRQRASQAAGSTSREALA